MLRPLELQTGFPVTFDGVATTTSAVWETLSAAREGDLGAIERLVEAQPILACCKYNYTPPMHFAVREGHVELVRYLLAKGGLFPNYRSDLFLKSFITIARERGHADMVELLEDVERDPQLAAPCVAPTDATSIEIPEAARRRAFNDLLSSGSRVAIEEALNEDPSLATDPYQCWGEGVLAVPCNRGDRAVVELLLRHGARVPDVSKWCGRYYFKHTEIAALLLDHGMNPNHMNWQHVTVLHEAAFSGEVDKVRLLLDHGANVNAIDEEFGMTPLELALEAGRSDVATIIRG